MIITREELEKDAVRLLKEIYDYDPFSVKNVALDRVIIENHDAVIYDSIDNIYNLDIEDILKNDSAKLSNVYWLMRYIDNYGDNGKIDTEDDLTVCTDHRSAFNITTLYCHSAICIDRNSPFYLDSLSAIILKDKPYHYQWVIIRNGIKHCAGDKRIETLEDEPSPTKLLNTFIKEESESRKKE